MSFVGETSTSSSSAAGLVEVVGKRKRISDHDLLHFEQVLLAADQISKAYFELRRKKSKLLSVAEENDDEASIADALIKTICVTTNSEKPETFTNAGDAVRWASGCILGARNKCIDDARNETCLHSLTPQQTLDAFQLVHKLNALISSHPPSQL